MDNILICAHKFLTQPDDDLVLFLNGKKLRNLLHIRHSFSDAPDRRSRVTWYKDGLVHKEYSTADYKWLPEPLIYVKEMLFTFKWAFITGVVWDMYIGMDGLCVFFGNMLRAAGKCGRTVYWAIDFVPESRFKSRVKNSVYHRINMLGYRHSSEMWDLSPRMAEARKKFLGVKPAEVKKQRVVPYGVWTERIKKYSYAECEKNTLVFMGHLIEKQGVQLVIRAIPKIVRVMPDFVFKIVGDGSYKNALQELAWNTGVAKHCRFMGQLADIRELEDEVARSCGGIAPYVKELDAWTYYADPGKIKTYLACGIPVLLTDIPWNAGEITEAGCGRIITEDTGAIVNAITELLGAENNQEYRKNAVNYSSKFDWASIFGDLFKQQA